VKIRCLECGEQFEPEARERICSAGCRDARRSRMARRSDKRHGEHEQDQTGEGGGQNAE